MSFWALTKVYKNHFLSTTRSTPVKCIRVVELFVSVTTLGGDAGPVSW